MSSVRSSAATAVSTSDPHLASKPAGLAVGDIIVIITATAHGYTSGTPSGFTLQSQTNTPDGGHGMAVYTKVATSADVAASNFPIGNSAGLHTWSITWAVQGVGTILWAGSGATAIDSTHKELAIGSTVSTDTLVLYAASCGANFAGWFFNGASPAPNEETEDFSGGDWQVYEAGHTTWPGAVTLEDVDVLLGANQAANIGAVVIGTRNITIVINNDDATTDDNDVILTMTAIAPPNLMCFSEDEETWTEWEPWATTRAFQLSPQTVYPAQTKTVHLAVRG